MRTIWEKLARCTTPGEVRRMCKGLGITLRSSNMTIKEENELLKLALANIVSCDIPNIPTGVTVSMEQFGPFAREVAEEALREVGYWDKEP